jgi:hypothetical protein
MREYVITQTILFASQDFNKPFIELTTVTITILSTVLRT